MPLLSGNTVHVADVKHNAPQAVKFGVPLVLGTVLGVFQIIIFVKYFAFNTGTVVHKLIPAFDRGLKTDNVRGI